MLLLITATPLGCSAVIDGEEQLLCKGAHTVISAAANRVQVTADQLLSRLTGAQQVAQRRQNGCALNLTSRTLKFIVEDSRYLDTKGY